MSILNVLSQNILYSEYSLNVNYLGTMNMQISSGLHPVTLAHLFHMIDCVMSSVTMCRHFFWLWYCSFKQKIQFYHLLSIPQFPAGHSPKTLNGLLSPLCEEAVRVSQSSLCNTLQEKDRSWVGSLAAEGSVLDHSAILPLHYKNLREKSDAHFVEVIKEDR